MEKHLQESIIDKHIGNVLRVRRRQLGMNQKYLAERLGLTFQQIQKYERGINRISASTLISILKILEVDPQYVFDGLSRPNEPTSGS
jgi:transcriptional regulator with XRE-family HTH domain